MAKAYFQHQVVIITGASYGIGRELAIQLSQQGARLALAARSQDLLEELAEYCRNVSKPLGGMAVALPTDVSEIDQCQKLIQHTYDEYGRIDTLINNSGFGVRGRFEKMQDTQLLEKVMQVNYWGSVYCTFHALPHLIDSKGRIVAYSSGAGIIPAPKSCGYAASKHAMVGFFDSIRIELARHGVSVTMIYPDWVETGITTRALGLDGKPLKVTGVHEEGAMTVEKCVHLSLNAIARRKRHLMLSTRLQLGAWFNYLLPGVVDHFAAQAFS